MPCLQHRLLVDAVALLRPLHRLRLLQVELEQAVAVVKAALLPLVVAVARAEALVQFLRFPVHLLRRVGGEARLLLEQLRLPAHKAAVAVPQRH